MTVIIDGSTGIVGATWTTANRPSSPAVGQRGFNTSINAAEIYNGAQWNPMSNGFSATGGTITRVGGYTIHTFLSSGTFTPDFAGEVEYLVVGGGGSGWYSSGAGGVGGGGAGGFRTASSFSVAATGLTVTVGAGGASASNQGNNGSDSVFSTITSTGGGAGANNDAAGAAGGSGGGGGENGGTGGAGTAGQGSAGGAAPSGNAGAGGGGASAVGGVGSNTVGGGGGIGTTSSISGSSVTYAGGGGGSSYNASSTGGAGGVGGGGQGTIYSSVSVATAGTANTGGGGGALGGGRSNTGSTAGGSGIVIIRYPTSGSVILPTVGTTGTVASVNMLQTRTQDSYAAANSGNGTVITPLNITFTPKQAGNKVILEFTVNGEASPPDVVFLVTRNDTLLADSTDASNNRWAGIVGQAYDVDVTSTPSNMSIRILDLNTLAVESTYKVQVRSSHTTASTYYLNRSINSAGANYHETSLSTVTATEIWT